MASTLANENWASLASSRAKNYRMVQLAMDHLLERLSKTPILQSLLVQIRQNVALELFDEAYINRLAENIGASSDSISSFVPDAQSFCPGI